MCTVRLDTQTNRWPKWGITILQYLGAVEDVWSRFWGGLPRQKEIWIDHGLAMAQIQMSHFEVGGGQSLLESWRRTKPPIASPIWAFLGGW